MERKTYLEILDLIVDFREAVIKNNIGSRKLMTQEETTILTYILNLIRPLVKE